MAAPPAEWWTDLSASDPTKDTLSDAVKAFAQTHAMDWSDPFRVQVTYQDLLANTDLFAGAATAVPVLTSDLQLQLYQAAHRAHDQAASAAGPPRTVKTPAGDKPSARVVPAPAQPLAKWAVQLFSLIKDEAQLEASLQVLQAALYKSSALSLRSCDVQDIRLLLEAVHSRFSSVKPGSSVATALLQSATSVSIHHGSVANVLLNIRHLLKAGTTPLRAPAELAQLVTSNAWPAMAGLALDTTCLTAWSYPNKPISDQQLRWSLGFSSVACDGRFLYTHSAHGLQKLGTGLSGTECGHLYASQSSSRQSQQVTLLFLRSPARLLLACPSLHSLGHLAVELDMDTLLETGRYVALPPSIASERAVGMSSSPSVPPGTAGTPTPMDQGYADLDYMDDFGDDEDEEAALARALALSLPSSGPPASAAPEPAPAPVVEDRTFSSLCADGYYIYATRASASSGPVVEVLQVSDTAATIVRQVQLPPGCFFPPPYHPRMDVVFSEPLTDLSLDAAPEGGVLIGALNPAGGPATRDGRLHPGQRLLAINGQSVSNMSPLAVGNLLKTLFEDPDSSDRKSQADEQDSKAADAGLRLQPRSVTLTVDRPVPFSAVAQLAEYSMSSFVVGESLTLLMTPIMGNATSADSHAAPACRVFDIGKPTAAVFIGDAGISPLLSTACKAATHAIFGSKLPHPTFSMTNAVHKGVTCDICRASPIHGPRFKDNELPDFDLCVSCYNNGTGDTSHVFRLMEVPGCVKQLLSPRCERRPSWAQMARACVPSGVCYDSLSDSVWTHIAGTSEIACWRPAAPATTSAAVAQTTAAGVGTAMLHEVGRIARAYLSFSTLDASQHTVDPFGTVVPIPQPWVQFSVPEYGGVLYLNPTTHEYRDSVPLQQCFIAPVQRLPVYGTMDECSSVIANVNIGSSVQVVERRGGWMKLQPSKAIVSVHKPSARRAAAADVESLLRRGGGALPAIAMLMQRLVEDVQEAEPEVEPPAVCWIHPEPNALVVGTAVSDAPDTAAPAGGSTSAPPASSTTTAAAAATGSASGGASGGDSSRAPGQLEFLPGRWTGPPEDLLQARVSVLWARGRWFNGTVLDHKDGQHFVQYDDGDQRWYNMSEKTFKVLSGGRVSSNPRPQPAQSGPGSIITAAGIGSTPSPPVSSPAGSTASQAAGVVIKQLPPLPSLPLFVPYAVDGSATAAEVFMPLLDILQLHASQLQMSQDTARQVLDCLYLAHANLAAIATVSQPTGTVESVPLEDQFDRAVDALTSGRVVQATRFFKSCVRSRGTDSLSAYNLACCYAVVKRKDIALAWLAVSVHWGYDNSGHAARDSDLASLFSDYRFHKLLRAMDGLEELPQLFGSLSGGTDNPLVQMLLWEPTGTEDAELPFAPQTAAAKSSGWAEPLCNAIAEIAGLTHASCDLSPKMLHQLQLAASGAMVACLPFLQAEPSALQRLIETALSHSWFVQRVSASLGDVLGQPAGSSSTDPNDALSIMLSGPDGASLLKTVCECSLTESYSLLDSAATLSAVPAPSATLRLLLLLQRKLLVDVTSRPVQVLQHSLTLLNAATALCRRAASVLPRQDDHQSVLRAVHGSVVGVVVPELLLSLFAARVPLSDILPPLAQFVCAIESLAPPRVAAEWIAHLKHLAAVVLNTAVVATSQFSIVDSLEHPAVRRLATSSLTYLDPTTGAPACDLVGTLVNGGAAAVPASAALLAAAHVHTAPAGSAGHAERAVAIAAALGAFLHVSDACRDNVPEPSVLKPAAAAAARVGDWAAQWFTAMSWLRTIALAQAEGDHGDPSDALAHPQRAQLCELLEVADNDADIVRLSAHANLRPDSLSLASTVTGVVARAQLLLTLHPDASNTSALEDAEWFLCSGVPAAVAADGLVHLRRRAQQVTVALQAVTAVLQGSQDPAVWQEALHGLGATLRALCDACSLVESFSGVGWTALQQLDRANTDCMQAVAAALASIVSGWAATAAGVMPSVHVICAAIDYLNQPLPPRESAWILQSKLVHTLWTLRSRFAAAVGALSRAPAGVSSGASSLGLHRVDAVASVPLLARVVDLGLCQFLAQILRWQTEVTPNGPISALQNAAVHSAFVALRDSPGRVPTLLRQCDADSKDMDAESEEKESSEDLSIMSAALAGVDDWFVHSLLSLLNTQGAANAIRTYLAASPNAVFPAACALLGLADDGVWASVRVARLALQLLRLVLPESDPRSTLRALPDALIDRIGGLALGHVHSSVRPAAMVSECGVSTAVGDHSSMHRIAATSGRGSVAVQVVEVVQTVAATGEQEPLALRFRAINSSWERVELQLEITAPQLKVPSSITCTVPAGSIAVMHEVLASSTNRAGASSLSTLADSTPGAHPVWGPVSFTWRRQGGADGDAMSAVATTVASIVGGGTSTVASPHTPASPAGDLSPTGADTLAAAGSAVDGDSEPTTDRFLQLLAEQAPAVSASRGRPRGPTLRPHGESSPLAAALGPLRSDSRTSRSLRGPLGSGQLSPAAAMSPGGLASALVPPGTASPNPGSITGATPMSSPAPSNPMKHTVVSVRRVTESLDGSAVPSVSSFVDSIFRALKPNDLSRSEQQAMRDRLSEGLARANEAIMFSGPVETCIGIARSLAANGIYCSVQPKPAGTCGVRNAAAASRRHRSHGLAGGSTQRLIAEFVSTVQWLAGHGDGFWRSKIVSTVAHGWELLADFPKASEDQQCTVVGALMACGGALHRVVPGTAVRVRGLDAPGPCATGTVLAVVEASGRAQVALDAPPAADATSGPEEQPDIQWFGVDELYPVDTALTRLATALDGRYPAMFAALLQYLNSPYLSETEGADSRRLLAEPWILHMARTRAVRALSSLVRSAKPAADAVRASSGLLKSLRDLSLAPRSGRAIRSTAQAHWASSWMLDSLARSGNGPPSTSSGADLPRSPTAVGSAGDSGELMSRPRRRVGDGDSGPTGWDESCGWHSYFLETGGAGGPSVQFWGFRTKDEDPRRGDTRLGRRSEEVVFVANAPIPLTTSKYYFEMQVTASDTTDRDAPAIMVGLWSDTAATRGRYGCEWGDGCFAYSSKTGAKAEWCRIQEGNMRLVVGEPVDVKDITGTVTWRASIIMQVREDAVQVHYFGWEAKWDEWIMRNSGRLAPLRTHTSGAIPSGFMAATPYGTPWGKQGDIVSVLWDLEDESLSFFLNGVPQGTAFHEGVRGELVPAVSVVNLHACVRLNVGQDAFKYRHEIMKPGPSAGLDPARIAQFRALAARRVEEAASKEAQSWKTHKRVRPKPCGCWPRRAMAMELADFLPGVSVGMIMRVLQVSGDDKHRAAEWLLTNAGSLPAGEDSNDGRECAEKTHLVVHGAGSSDWILEHSCASFSGLFPPAPGLTIPLAMAVPATACTDLTDPASCAGCAVVVDRGECTFVKKVRTVQAAGGAAVILVSDSDVSFIPDCGTESCDDLTIPVAMLTKNDGTTLKAALARGQRLTITMKVGWTGTGAPVVPATPATGVAAAAAPAGSSESRSRGSSGSGRGGRGTRRSRGSDGESPDPAGDLDDMGMMFGRPDSGTGGEIDMDPDDLLLPPAAMGGAAGMSAAGARLDDDGDEDDDENGDHAGLAAMAAAAGSEDVEMEDAASNAPASRLAAHRHRRVRVESRDRAGSTASGSRPDADDVIQPRQDAPYDPSVVDSWVLAQAPGCVNVPGLVDDAGAAARGAARGAGSVSADASSNRLTTAETEWLANVDARLRERRVPNGTRDVILGLLRQGGENNLAMARTMLDDVNVVLPERPSADSVTGSPATGRSPGSPLLMSRRTRSLSYGGPEASPSSRGLAGAPTVVVSDAAPRLTIHDARPGMLVAVMVSPDAVAAWHVSEAAAASQTSPELSAGTRVKARWSGGGWYDAKITVVHPDNTYDVHYSDGDQESRLTLDRLRLVRADGTLVRVSEPSTAGSDVLAAVWVPEMDDIAGGSVGVVVRVDQEDAVVLVRFEDVEREHVREWWLPPNLLAAAHGVMGTPDAIDESSGHVSVHQVVMSCEDNLCTLHARDTVLDLMTHSSDSRALDSISASSLLQITAAQCFAAPTAVPDVCEHLRGTITKLGRMVPAMLEADPRLFGELAQPVLQLLRAGSLEVFSNPRRPAQSPAPPSMLVKPAVDDALVSSLIVSLSKSLVSPPEGGSLALHAARAGSPPLLSIGNREVTDAATGRAMMHEHQPLTVTGNKVWVARAGVMQYKLWVAPVSPNFGCMLWIIDRYLAALASVESVKSIEALHERAHDVLAAALDALMSILLSCNAPSPVRVAGLIRVALIIAAPGASVLVRLRADGFRRLYQELCNLHDVESRVGSGQLLHSELLQSLMELFVTLKANVSVSTWMSVASSHGHSGSPSVSVDPEPARVASRPPRAPLLRSSISSPGRHTGGVADDEAKTAGPLLERTTELVCALEWLHGTRLDAPRNVCLKAWEKEESSLKELLATESKVHDVKGLVEDGNIVELVSKAAARSCITNRRVLHALVRWTNWWQGQGAAAAMIGTPGRYAVPIDQAVEAATSAELHQQYPDLAGVTAAQVRLQLAMLSHLNSLAVQCLGLVRLSTDGVAGPVQASIMACKDLLFFGVKQSWFSEALDYTSVASNTRRPKVRVNRFTAAMATTGSDTVFGQLSTQLRKVPPQLLRQVRTTPHLAFEVQLMKERVAGESGPYREVFADCVRELLPEMRSVTGRGAAEGSEQAAAQDVLQMFVPCGNAVAGWGDNRDCHVPRPSNNSAPQLQQFEDFGRLMGAAIRTGVRMPLAWPSLVWKPLVGQQVELSDLQGVDTILVDRIIMPLSSPELTEQTFQENFADSLTQSAVLSDGTLVPRYPGGEDEEVTFETAKDYAQWLSHVRLHECAAQVEAMRKGLAQVIPAGVLQLFSWRELELIVCGSAEVDIELLSRHTQYGAGVDPNAAHIRYFWAALREFTNDERRQFIKFAWGQERLPVSDREYASHSVRLLIKPWTARGNHDQALPLADTCFFNITLPPYSSLEIMKRQLRRAFQTCTGLDGDDVQVQ